MASRLGKAVSNHPRAVSALFLFGLIVVSTQPVAAGAVGCHGP